MDFQLSAQEQAFRQEVKNFFEREITFPPDWKPYRQMDLSPERLGFIQGVARKLGGRGWLTLSWPKEYGGRQAPMLDAILVEEAAYYGLMYARDVDTGAVAVDIIRFGNEEQKRQHLPPIAHGELYWSVGLSEPGVGSDLAGVQLRAEERDDYFLVNGQKVWISNTHNASWIELLTRTDPQATPKHRGLSFLLIELKNPGIMVRPLTSLTNGKPNCEVFFDNVRVPKKNLLGEKNRGFYMAMMALEGIRFQGDLCPGNARRVLEHLQIFARVRGMKPELRQKLAEMAIELEVARLFYYRNVWLQTQHFPFSMEPSITKAFVSEFNRRLYRVGMEMLGLYGLLGAEDQYAPIKGELSYLYFDSVKDTIIDGTSEIQRNIISGRGLGLPRG